jgi:type IV pilus assembly protein PilY1
MLKYIPIFCLLIFISMNGASADDTEIFAVRVDPNVLIIMDNSGSMNEVIYHKNYNPLTTYSGGYTSGAIYRRHHSTYQLMDVTENGRTVSILYGPGDDNTGVRYNGNYLNWIFWHGTDVERSEVAVQSGKTRIQVAREVLTYLINNTPRVRFGLMRFDFEHGGWLSAPCGSNISDLITAINGMLATTWTPLSETMIEAWDYYTGSNNSFYRGARYNSPIQYYCQKDFIILITDGEPTMDWTFPNWVLPAIAGQYDTTPQSGNNNNPYYLDGVAWYLNVSDARSNLAGLQNIITYPIGFSMNHPLLERTASKGGGLYFTADNAEQLTDALEKVIIDIDNRSFSFTSPSVPAVRTVHDKNIYLTSFEPNETPFWKGDLKAYRLETDGTLKVDGSGNPDSSSLIWGATEKLKTNLSAERNIKTHVRGATRNFTTAEITNADLEVADDTTRHNLIAHIRGVDVFDIDPKDGITNVDRRSKLADIFHSNPVIVGSPSKFFRDEGFDGPGGFYESKKKRSRVVIVGTNGGMLHAFHAGNWVEAQGGYDEGTGVEEWAFIPNSVLKNLKLMTSMHTFYVDSSPKVSDVWWGDLNSNGRKDPDEWRTVLICGLRKGGKHYFALDITDTKNPVYLWEFPHSGDPNIADYTSFLNTLGQSWSEPAIGKVKSGQNERWVAFVGAGFDPSETKNRDATVGRGFMVIDMTNGRLIKEFSGLAGMTSAFAAPPTAVDMNLDGFIDRVYIGDLGGQMWVFDVSSSNKDEWVGKRLFQAPATNAEKHPIYYQPAVAFDRNKVPWIFFGTGDRENPNDSTNPPERFYAVKDDGQDPYPRKEENLKDLIGLGENTFARVTGPQKGWFIKLEKTDGRHEKVLSKPAVFNRLVYFTTYSYKQTNDPCQVAGDAKLYVVEYLSGGGALLVDELQDLSGTASERSKVIGEGIPSAPVISVNTKGRASFVIGTTSGQVVSQEGFSPATNKGLLYWREVVR